MSKNDDLGEIPLPPPEGKDLTYLGLGGKKVKQEQQHFTKCVVSSFGYDQISKHFYVKVGFGELVDPYGTNRGISQAKLNSSYNYRKVSQKTYDAFVKYLKTKNRIHFTNARRLLISENY